ncbi:MAG TPA: DJ-1/PfpI family protein [Chthoniobacteraceae bacterium]|nr:DJ-1/PfpI family protein [Chthoniobacteraceae bacterium]
MSKKLENKRVAILAADGFEQSELEEPMNALEEAGADLSIVSTKADNIQGMHHAVKATLSRSTFRWISAARGL